MLDELPTTLSPDSDLGLAEIQALLDHIPHAALFVDARNERIACANQLMAALSGRNARHLVGLPIEALFPAFDEKNALGDHTDLTLLHANGERINVRVRQKPLPPLGFWVLLSVAMDVDPFESLPEKINALLAAPPTNDLNQSITQALQIAVWLCGAVVAAYYQADATRPLFELTAACGDTQPLPPTIPLRELANLQSAMLWRPQERPNSSVHRTARAHHLTYVASAPVGEPNAWVGLVAFGGMQAEAPALALPLVQLLARHLTVRIQTLQQMQNANRQLEQQRQQTNRQALVFDSLRDGVIYISPTRQIEAMNAYAEHVLGYASQEVYGQPIENVLIGSDTLPISLDTARHSGYAQDADNAVLYRRDGKTFQAGLRIQPLSVAGEPSGWAILLQDLSQEEQSRVRIQQLEQRALLGEVTAIFAHEVRNPINNISTGLQLMAMNLPPDAAEQAQLNRMQQDCDRLSELMKSVLAFARPQEYKLEALSIEAFLTRLLERWHPRLARANVSHTLHIEPNLPGIQADPRALEQVFTNLIHNAMQAMSETGGKLTLRVRQNLAENDGHYIEVSVADTGPGIPDELRERVFEPFFTTKAGGTGLGLAITRQIVTAHRGVIQVTSIPGGTAFQVLLPADENTGRSARQEENLSVDKST